MWTIFMDLVFYDTMTLWKTSILLDEKLEKHMQLIKLSTIELSNSNAKHFLTK